MPPTTLRTVTLLLIASWEVQGRIAGLSLVGNEQVGTPPFVTFGSDPAAATTVTARGDVLEVRRGGSAHITLSSEVTRLPETTADGVFTATGLSANQVPQWSLWDLDTFDAVDSNQWSLNDHGFCGSPQDSFLGGHCKFAASKTARRYTTLPPHTRVRITARIHFIDQWNDESVFMMVDGNPVWAESHNWCPGFLKWMCMKYGLDSCGRDTPDRLSVHAQATLSHSTPVLDLSFGSSLPEGTDPCYTSWAIDDVSVELL